MRLGLLGPAKGDLPGLGRAAEWLLNTLKVDRAIYLGDDLALERAVTEWAMRLVGHDPTDDGVWARATELALRGAPREIDGFVRSQFARLRLRALESLPPAGSRTIEMIGDRVAILIHDKALLDEEDIFAASVLVYGKSEEPLLRRIGARWFITPGPTGGRGGVAVLEEEDDEVIASFYDAAGQRTLTESLTMTRTGKLRVQGTT